MFNKIKRAIKGFFRGLKNLFKKEPITAAATITAIPVILYHAPKIAATFSSANPALFVIALSTVLIPMITRMIWNAQ